MRTKANNEKGGGPRKDAKREKQLQNDHEEVNPSYVAETTARGRAENQLGGKHGSYH